MPEGGEEEELTDLRLEDGSHDLAGVHFDPNVLGSDPHAREEGGNGCERR